MSSLIDEYIANNPVYQLLILLDGNVNGEGNEVDSDEVIDAELLTSKEYKENITSVKNTKKYSKENDIVEEVCALCLGEFKSQCTLHVTRCKHHYHPKCLKEYLTKRCRGKICCPVCRENIKS